MDFGAMIKPVKTEEETAGTELSESETPSSSYGDLITPYAQAKTTPDRGTAGHWDSIKRGATQVEQLYSRSVYGKEMSDIIGRRLERMPEQRYSDYKEVEGFWSALGYGVERAEEQLAGVAAVGIPAAIGGAVAGPPGAAALSGAALGPMHMGESLMALDEKGVENPTMMQALPAAAINTALDMGMVTKTLKVLDVANKLGFEKKAKSLAAESLKRTRLQKMRKTGTDLTTLGVLEGSTEVLQDVTNDVNAGLMADEEFVTALKGAVANGDELAESFWAGFAGSVTLGAGGKAILSPLGRDVPGQNDINPFSEDVPSDAPPPQVVNEVVDDLPPEETDIADAPYMADEPAPETVTQPAPTETATTQPRPAPAAGTNVVEGIPEGVTPTAGAPLNVDLSGEGGTSAAPVVANPDAPQPAPASLEKPVDEEGVIQEPPEVTGTFIADNPAPRDYLEVVVNTGEGPTHKVIDIRQEESVEAVEEAYKSLEEDVLHAKQFPIRIDEPTKEFLERHMDETFATAVTGVAKANELFVKDKGDTIIHPHIGEKSFRAGTGFYKGDTIIRNMVSGVYSSLITDNRKLLRPVDQKLDEAFLENLDNLATLFKEQYFPEGHTFIQLVNKPRKSAEGWMTPFSKSGKTATMVSINLQGSGLKKLIAEYGINSKEVHTEIRQTLNHEMGHAMIAHRTGNIPLDARMGMVKEYLKTIEGIASGKMTVREFYKRRFTKETYKRLVSSSRKAVLDSPMLDKVNSAEESKYMLSYEEYYVEQLADRIMRAKGMRTPQMSWAEGIIADLKDFISKNFDRRERPMALSRALDSVKQYQDLTNAAATVGDRLSFTQNELKKVAGVEDKVDYKGLQEMSRVVNFLSDTPYQQLYTSGNRSLQDKFVEGLEKQYRVSTGFKKWHEWILSPNQISRRFKFKEGLEYMEQVRLYYVTKMQSIASADLLAKKWGDLSAKQDEALSEFFIDVDARSRELERKLTPGEIQFYIKKHKLEPAARDLIAPIQKSFRAVLSKTQAAIEEDVVRNFIKNPRGFMKLYRQTATAKERQDLLMDALDQDVGQYIKLTGELNKIQENFKPLYDRDYFPRKRFGNYVIIIKEKDEEGNLSVVEYSTFESESEYKKSLAEAQSLYAQDVATNFMTVQGTLMDETAKSLWGMPQLVIDKIQRSLEAAGDGLTQPQKEALRDAALDLSPGRRYLKHYKKRKDVDGASRDGLRSYAAYMSSASNHLARVRHASDLVEKLKGLEEAAKNITGDSSDLQRAYHYYNRHFKYIMNPSDDGAAIRNVGFLWFLAYSPKSALVNLSQLPMVTYPWMATRYGDVAATKHLTSASKDIALHYKSRKGFTPEETSMIDALVQEGIIDESFAMELSSLSNGSAMARLTKSKGVSRAMASFTYYGGYMFSAMEKYNRLTNALAAYRADRESGSDHAQAVNTARTSVSETQFEYAKWDRPQAMRGYLSIPFLFMNYVQNFMFLAFNGDKNPEGRQTALRMWATMLMIGGLQGLPGAEWLLSLVDFFGSQLNKSSLFREAFGVEDPHTNSRLFLREIMGDLTNPTYADLIMKGTSRNGFGSGALLTAVTGQPVSFDLSGSLSMGAPIQAGRDFDYNGYGFNDFMRGITGAPGGIVGGIWDAVQSDNPDDWKRMEIALPVAAKNASKGMRWLVRGKEEYKGGAEFMNMEDRQVQAIGQMMGFGSTDLNRLREEQGEKYQVSMYWQNRRSHYLTELGLAQKHGDKERMVELRKQIAEFNESLKAPELQGHKITNKAIAKYLKSKDTRDDKREKGLPAIKKDEEIFKSIEKIFNN